MADCEYQIGGQGKFYSESEFKKLLSEGYLDKVMLENQLKIKGVKPNEELAKSFQLPSAIQTQAPIEAKDNYKVAQEVTAEVSKENPDASVLLTPKGEDLSLTAVYVGKENRGKGIGTKVLESVKKQADKLGKKIVLDATAELDEETDLGRLESLYERNGFTKVGDNKFEYNPTAEVTEEVVTPTETVTKTEEVVTEPTAELKDVESTAKELMNFKKPTLLDKVAKMLGGEKFSNSKRRRSKDDAEVERQQEIDDIVNKNPTSRIKIKGDEIIFNDGKTLYDKLISNNFTEQEAFGIIDVVQGIFPSEFQEYYPDSFKNENTEDISSIIEEEFFKRHINDQLNKDNAKNKLKSAKAYINNLIPENTYGSVFTDKSINFIKDIVNNFENGNVFLFTDTQLKDLGISKNKNKKIINSFDISEAYHKAKADGSNPELVKSVEKLLGKEEPKTETKQPTKEAQVAKGLADTLRKAKLNLPKGTAMASLAPGFDKVWDATIETVAKAIEVGGVTAGNFRQSINNGMKALRNTDAYKAITDPKERAKISSQYRKALVDLVPQYFNFNADNLRAAEFDTLNEELEAAKGKDLDPKAFNALKAKAKKFVNDNLPVDNYRKTEVKSYVAKNFDKAKNVADIQKNLEAVNALLEGKEAKTAEQKRKETIAEITKLVKPKGKSIISTNKRTGRKTGKISLDAQGKLNELRNQGVFNNLDALTQEELDNIRDNVKNILEKGKADRNFDKAIEDSKKRADQAMILEELGGEPEILNGEEEILERLTDDSGVVIVNGQSMNKSRFETFISNNPDADLSDVKFYYNEQTNVKQLKQNLQSTYKRAKATTLMALRDLETAVLTLQKGSLKMRNWLENNMMKPIREAENKKQDFIYRTNLNHDKKLKETFGGVQVKGKTVISLAPYTLNASSTISAGETSLKSMKSEKLTNAEVIQFYGEIVNQDKNLTELSDDKKANREILKKFNRIDPETIIDYMNDPKNKKLMDYYNYLADSYNGQFAQEFVPLIEELYDIKIEKGNYWPGPKSGAGTDVGSLLNLEGDNSANLSLIAPNMKPRTGGNYPLEILSATEMFNRYTETMAHAKEFLPITKNVFSLLSNNNLPHIINKFNDINKYNKFIEDLNVVLTDKSPFKSHWSTPISNTNALKMLWFRPKSVIQQAISGAHFYHAGIKDGVYPHDVLAASLPVNKDELKFLKEFYLDNSYLWTRLSGGMTTQDTQAAKLALDKLLEKTFKQGLSASQFTKDAIKIFVNAGMSQIKLGDFLSASAPTAGMNFALAQFRKNQSSGNDYASSKEEAMQRWFEESERVLQPVLGKETISSATYDPFYRIMFPFSSANNAMMKKVYKAALNLSDWKNLNNREKTQSAVDILYYTFAAGLPFALISSGGILAWARLNDEEDENLAEAQKKRILFDALMDSGQSNMGTLGILGNVMKSYINTQRGKDWYNNIPFLEELLAYNDLLVGLSNEEGDVSKLDKNEWNAFLRGYEPSEFEMRKIKKMTPEEAEKYFQENPFARKVFYGDVAKKYSELNAYQKLDYKGKKAFERIIGTKNLNEFVEGFGALIDENAEIEEILLGVKARKEEGEKFDVYFKDRKTDKIYKEALELYEKLTGEKTLEEEMELSEREKKAGRSQSRPSSPRDFKPRINKPRIPKF
jgi:ribosomal protein S18 acetylase RimI-like enzyme